MFPQYFGLLIMNKYAQYSKVEEAKKFRNKRMFGSATRCVRKKAFDTENLAMSFHGQNRKDFPDANPQRAYKCKHCLKWHLATINKPKKNKAVVAQR